MKTRSFVFIIFFLLSLSSIACKTYKRPTDPGPNVYQGYYHSLNARHALADSVGSTPDWTNIMHVDVASYDVTNRLDELAQLIQDYSARGKKFILEMTAYYYDAYMLDRPFDTLRFDAILSRLEPLKGSLLAVQLLDEPLSWKDKKAAFLGRSHTSLDKFSESQSIQFQALRSAQVQLATLGVPFSANFDDVDDVGPRWPIVVTNLYSRTGKLEKTLNRYYWKADLNKQKLWVTARAFSAQIPPGNCGFHCRDEDELRSSTEETIRLLRAYGIETVLWFIHHSYDYEAEKAQGANEFPFLLTMHQAFFGTLVPPVLAGAALIPDAVAPRPPTDYEYVVRAPWGAQPVIRRLSPAEYEALFSRH